MTDTINDQVAQFAAQLDGLSVFDAQQIATDIHTLGRQLIEAPSHNLAAVALREFVDARPDGPQYAQAVIVATLSQFSLYILLAAEMHTLDGADGLLRRIKRLAYAARGLGVAESLGMTR